MIHECIPFTAIPHTTRLYSDYLFHHKAVSEFYPHAPNPGAVASYARGLEFPPERRAKVADVLERQNRSFGCDAGVLESIDRLRRGAVAVVSGQQVGLFGGPLYSLLKAASAIQLARELSAQGVDAVPFFWLATEDHDLAEVNHSVLPIGRHELRPFTSGSSAKGEPPVGKIRFQPEIAKLAHEAAQHLNDDEIRTAVVESYREGETYGSAFAKLVTRMFSGHGLILLDPLAPELHAIAAPLFREAAERAAELDSALLERGEKIRKRGYHEQVRVTSDSTLLFSLEGGNRKVIHLAGDDFLVGTARVSRAEMLSRIESKPDDFSANVLLRPVMQDWLLPTVAYFGGPAEIAYFAQVDVVYQKLLRRTTPVLPRLSLTVVDGRMQRLLKKYRLGIPDLFHGSEQLRENIAERSMPADLQQQFITAEDQLRESLEQITAGLQKLDPTLVDAAERSARKMRYQLQKMKSKAARAELRRNEQLTSDALEILTMLFPQKGLQERTLPGIYLIGVHGSALLESMLEIAKDHCPGHHLLYV